MDFSRCFAKKSVLDIQKEVGAVKLKRTLGPINLISLGIGCIIGTGIFVLSGHAAALHAGPAVVLSFVLAGIACAFAALCYAELASVLPISGSAYTYAYATLGESMAWVMGWLLLLEYGVASATVAVGWSGYVVSFLHTVGFNFPLEWAHPYGEAFKRYDGSEGVGIFNLPAFIGVAGVSALLVAGVQESARVNNVIVCIKLAVILTFIAVGAGHIDVANWHPFIPENTGHFGDFGMSGVLSGASMIFFAYIGFEAVSTAAQEAKNPQRDMPFGIIGALVVCTILYILVSGVLTGIVPYTALNVPDPIAVGVDAIGLPWLSFVVKIGAIMGLTSVMLVLIYGQTRIFFSMSRDGLLPKMFSTIHPTLKTPHIGTSLLGLLIALIAGLVPLKELGDLVNMGTLVAFMIICFTVLYMRRKEPKLLRPFICPGVPVVPVLGIVSCFALILGLPRETYIYIGVWLVVGMLLYVSYGMQHSKIGINLQKAPKKVQAAIKKARKPVKKKKR